MYETNLGTENEREDVSSAHLLACVLLGEHSSCRRVSSLLVSDQEVTDDRVLN